VATINFVVSQSNFADGVDVSAEYIVDNNIAPVMRTSYGSCETDLGPVENAFYNSLWQQAAAQGITSFVAAGDAGGAGCDAPTGGVYSSGGLAVNGIASTPYNVAVGGSQFNDTNDPSKYWSAVNDPTTGESALGYIPEMVWNESSNDPNEVLLYAGGGGISTLYTKPKWQVGVGVPNDHARDLPDISLSASLHDGYLVCLEGNCGYGDYFYSFGGTSASSPAAAGIMALVNQKMGGKPQGMANYVFYRLASVSGIYHDIVKGNNKVPDSNGQYTVGFNARKGYDLATGMGSMDVTALVNNWKAPATEPTTAVTLALEKGQSATVVHGKPIAFEATVACSETKPCAPTGAVALSATSSSGTTVAAGSGELTTLSGSSVADIVTSVVPGGKYKVTARYGGDGKNGPGVSEAVPVTVSAENSQTFVGSVGGGTFATGPVSVGYGESWPVAVIVAGNSGYGFPSGKITMTADGTPITNGGVYDYASGTFTPSTMTLNYGEKSIMKSGLPTNQSSTVSYVLPTQMLGVGTHQLFAAYPGDPGFHASHGSYSYSVTQAQGVIEDFFPIGDTVANAPVQLAAQVGFASLGFAPYGGSITVSDITSGTRVVLGKGKVDSSLYGGYWTATVNVPTPGTRTLRLDYTGDSNVKGVSQTYYVPFTANDYSSVNLSTNLSTSFGQRPDPEAEDSQTSSAKGQASFDLGSVASDPRHCCSKRSATAHARHDRRPPPQRTFRASLVVVRRRKHVVVNRNRLPEAATAVREDHEELGQGSSAGWPRRRSSAMGTGVPRFVSQSVHVSERGWWTSRSGELPQQGSQTSRRGSGASQTDLPGAPPHDGDPSAKSGISEGYSGTLAALARRHHRKRVHARTSRERAANGRNGLRNAYHQQGSATRYVVQ
jgi:hypothetical protein